MSVGQELRFKKEHFLFSGAGNEAGVNRKASIRTGEQKLFGLNRRQDLGYGHCMAGRGSSRWSVGRNRAGWGGAEGHGKRDRRGWEGWGEDRRSANRVCKVRKDAGIPDEGEDGLGVKKLLDFVGRGVG